MSDLSPNPLPDESGVPLTPRFGEAMEQIASAEREGNAQLASIIALAVAQAKWKDHDEAGALAMLSKVERIANVSGDSLPQQERYRILGGAYCLHAEIADLRGRADEAVHASTLALSQYELLSDRRLVIDALNVRSSVYLHCGELLLALHDAREALRAGQETMYVSGEARALTNVANVETNTGDYDQAIPRYDRALALYEVLNDVTGRAVTLYNVAIVHRNLGDNQKGLDYFLQSAAMFRDLNDSLRLAHALEGVGTAHSKLGQQQEALEYYESSLSLRRALGDEAGIADTLCGKAIVYEETGQLDNALRMYRESLAIREAIGDKRGTAVSLHGIGMALVKCAHRSTEAKTPYLRLARRVLTRAATIANSVGLMQTLFECHEQLSVVAQELGYLEASLQHLQEFLRVRDVVTKEETVQSLQRLQVRIDLERATQRAELEHVRAEHLMELNRTKSQFFSNISHEFRTPITLMLSRLKMLETSNVGEDTREALSEIQSGALHLLSLASQVLTLSRIESGVMTLRVAPHNLADSVKRASSSFIRIAAEHKIDLEVHLPEKPVYAYYGKQELESVFENVLSNAHKFTSPGGRIVVRLTVTKSADSSSNQSAVIDISDTGIGIPQESLTRIFERYYQVDDSHTRMQSGTGLGLAYARELIELHHGSIGVTSSIGEGSTFSIRLPVGRDHFVGDAHVDLSDAIGPVTGEPVHQPGFSDADASSSAPFTEPPVILMIDDEQATRELYRAFLSSAHYEILEAENGTTGLALAKERIPDLILCDVMMPDLSGMEVCADLKAWDLTAHIPVILVTALGDNEAQTRANNCGADSFVSKPFDRALFLSRISNTLVTRKRLIEKFLVEAARDPNLPRPDSKDHQFLAELNKVIESNIREQKLNVGLLSKELGRSKTVLNRWCRSYTQKSPAQYISWFRCLRAYERLKVKGAVVTTVAIDVGFEPSQFSRHFKKWFGKRPMDIAKHTRED